MAFSFWSWGGDVIRVVQDSFPVIGRGRCQDLFTDALTVDKEFVKSHSGNVYCGSFHFFGQCKLFAEIAGGKAAPLCLAVTGGRAVQADPLPLPVCFIQ